MSPCRPMRFSLRAFLIIALLLITHHSLLTTARAQSASATLSGTVTDPNKAAIAGAHVTATNNRTGLKREATTNDAGTFTIPLLPPSTYTVLVENQGFTPAEIKDVTLNVGDNVALNIQLKIGSVGATIDVKGDASLINESPAVATVVDRQFVENMPLNGRSFQSLLTLTPGVLLTRAGEVDPGQFSVNGQRASANYFMVDGVGANLGAVPDTVLGQYAGGTVPATTAAGGMNNLVSIDALQEFKVLTSTYAPEFGRTPGGQILIATRSGTNEFHGTVFDYFRNDVLDANDWFANRAGLHKPAERQNDFGGVLGGPILKNRTFFFFSYEGLRLRQPQTKVTQVPSLASRQAAPASIRPFLEGFPRPNGADIANGFALFSASYSDPASLDATSIRVDHTVMNKLTVFGRYNRAPSSVQARALFGGALNQIGDVRYVTETVTGGATLSISPSFINDLRFNWSRNGNRRVNELDNFGGAAPPPPSQFFPVGFGSASPVNFVFQVSPTFYQRVDSVNTSVPQRQINVIDSVSAARGAHRLKFGVDYRRLYPQFAPLKFNGLANFSSLAVAATGRVSAGSSFISSAPPRFPVFVSTSTYAQDTWKLTPRLMLTYGMRWEINFYPREENGLDPVAVTGLENPATIALAPKGTPLWKTTYGNFAPRIGVAYQLYDRPNHPTVLRGGFGVFYDLGWGGQTQAFAGSWPFVVRKPIPSGTPFPFDASVTPAGLNPNLPATDIFVTAPDFKLPYTLEWNSTIEQGLGANQDVTLSYVGAVGRRLLRQEVLRNPNPNFVNVWVTTNLATSDYHALQLQFRRRLSRGLQAIGSYTWSHSIDIASSDFGFGASAPSERVNPSIDRGASDFDVRHAFNAAVTYDVPALFGGPLGKAVAEGWGIDAVVTARSATPVNVLASFIDLSFGGSLSLRPDIVSGVPLYLYGDTFPGGKRFNPAAFVPGPPDRQGTLPRNLLRGFSMSQVDLAVRRQFKLWERLQLQFRAEFFNVLNHPNFGDPGGFQGNVLSSSLFGLSTQMFGRSLGSGNLGGFNPLYQVGGPRSGQLSLKLIF